MKSEILFLFAFVFRAYEFGNNNTCFCGPDDRTYNFIVKVYCPKDSPPKCEVSCPWLAKQWAEGVRSESNPQLGSGNYNTCGIIVQKLEVDNFTLRTFPNLTIFNKLESVTFSNNSMENVSCEDFQQLPQTLKFLSIKYNKLNAIPGTCSEQLDLKLKSLDLSYNQILKVDGYSFRGLNILATLNLEGNQNVGQMFGELVQAIPSSITSLDLTNCSLDQNHLRATPQGSANRLINLANLYLSFNCFTLLPSKLDEGRFMDIFPALQRIYLDNNFLQEFRKIGRINGSFSLELLDLSSNYLLEINPHSLTGFPKLQHVNLDNNLLVTLKDISHKMTDAMDKNNVISIRNNPLNCDANLNWTKNGQFSGQFITDNKPCKCPWEWANKSWINITLDMLKETEVDNCTTVSFPDINEIIRERNCPYDITTTEDAISTTVTETTVEITSTSEQVTGMSGRTYRNEGTHEGDVTDIDTETMTESMKISTEIAQHKDGDGSPSEVTENFISGPETLMTIQDDSDKAGVISTTDTFKNSTTSALATSTLSIPTSTVKKNEPILTEKTASIQSTTTTSTASKSTEVLSKNTTTAATTMKTKQWSGPKRSLVQNKKKEDLSWEEIKRLRKYYENPTEAPYAQYIGIAAIVFISVEFTLLCCADLPLFFGAARRLRRLLPERKPHGQQENRKIRVGPM